jgi:putative two-component system response regulator
MSTANTIHQQIPNSLLGSLFHSANILIVDDETVAREGLARKLAGLGYDCRCCESGQAACDLLANKKYDLILAHVLAPEAEGVAFLKTAINLCPDVAVIFIASVADIEMAVDSLKDGAYDYITKPFSLEEVSISVVRALEKRQLLIDNRNYQHALEEQVASRTRQLQEAMRVLQHTYDSTLVALSRALDSREADSDGHSLRTTVYAKRLAKKLGLNEADTRVVEHGVLLHDIGKIGIPDGVLRKTGSLGDGEKLLVRKHPEIGYRILSSIKFLKGAAELVLHHHERYDGKGYPQGLKGEAIDLGARIFAVAAALDDLTSNRPFQAAMDFEDAIREIERRSGTELDPALVKACLEIPASEWKEIRKEIRSDAKLADFLEKRVSG